MVAIVTIRAGATRPESHRWRWHSASGTICPGAPRDTHYAFFTTPIPQIQISTHSSAFRQQNTAALTLGLYETSREGKLINRFHSSRGEGLVYYVAIGIGLSFIIYTTVFLLRKNIIIPWALFSILCLFILCCPPSIQLSLFAIKWAALAIVTLLATLFYGDWAALLEKIKSRPEVVALCLWLPFSCVVSPIPLQSFLTAGSIALVLWFSSFLMPAYIPPSRYLQDLLKVFLIVRLPFVLINFVPFAADPSPLWSIGKRFSGIADNPNGLAHVAWGVFVLLFYYLLRERHGFRKLIYITCMLITGLLLLATGSRAGILAAIVGSLLLVWLLMRRTFVFLLIVVLLISPALIWCLRERIDKTVYYVLRKARIITSSKRVRDDPTSGRLYLWRQMLRDWSRSPILGVGLRVPGKAACRGKVAYRRLGHSEYISVLRELGIVGLVLFALIWFGGVYRLGVLSSVQKEACAALALVVACLVYAQFEYLHFKVGNHMAIMFYALLSPPQYRVGSTSGRGLDYHYLKFSGG